MVCTSTASGKSVCYNGPVVDELLRDPASTALYMFPTKALAQDQVRALGELCGRLADPSLAEAIGVYDGDTAERDRQHLKQCGRLIITNPDMLHLTMLPHHRSFQRFLRNLKYVVVDEGHAYRGVFGNHVALVLRRLRRLAETVYGARLQFVVSSATIANPEEHVRSLSGVQEWQIVSKDGSPSGKKTFVLWNPPLRKSDGPSRTEKRSNPDARVLGKAVAHRTALALKRGEEGGLGQARYRWAAIGARVRAPD